MIYFKVIANYQDQILADISNLPFNVNYCESTLLVGLNTIVKNDLNRALLALLHIDDVQVIYDTDKQIIFNKADYSHTMTELEINSFKFKPFNHQIAAINYGLHPKHQKWLLLDGMGLGKTATIIGYAEMLKKRHLVEHCIIICAVDSLRQNWKKEIQKFSNESVLVLGEKITKNGTIRYDTLPNRASQLKNKIDEFFIIINIAAIRSDKILEAFLKSLNNFGVIAVDEIHRLVSKTSSQSSNLLKMKTPYKVGATGTLLTGNPTSCYVPLFWTENDHATLTNFKAQYCIFGGFNDAQIIGTKNIEWLKEEIASCSLRRTLEEVRKDMPSKTIEVELLEMSDNQRTFYEAIKDGVKEEADKIELNTSNYAALVTRLRQATVCPNILTTQAISSIKLDRCKDLVEDLVAQNEKVVVLSNFKQPAYELQKMLASYSPLVVTGDTPETEASKSVDLFQTDPNYKIIIGTHGKLGTGFTLNAAMYLIMLDTPYSWASFSQSVDRIYRINNTRPAYTVVLICKDTFDEDVQEIVDTKKALSDYVLNNLNNPSADQEKLTYAMNYNETNELLKRLKDL